MLSGSASSVVVGFVTLLAVGITSGCAAHGRGDTEATAIIEGAAGVVDGFAQAHIAPRSAPRPASTESGDADLPVILPGEFEPVDHLLMAWDENLEAFFVDLVAAAVGQAEITLLLQPDEAPEMVEQALAARGIDPSDLTYKVVPIESIWVRDFGPLVVRTRSGRRRAVDLAYFRDSEDDVPARLAREDFGWQIDTVPLRTEGGNVLSDGTGQCVMTDELIADGRHQEAEVRRLVREHLGCRELVLLPMLYGEPTGHVDMYVAITGPSQAIVGTYLMGDDPSNAELLDEAAERLRQAGFLVRRVPMPHNEDGHFRSYTNSLALNDVVLVPVFPEDTSGEAEALATYRAAYPGRRIVPIVSTEVIEMAGAVHCATMTVSRR